ncbi:calcium/sodium antiporter [Coprothermobacteraceae bacterium]|nr:calcium/sodium antiporter [Coprothermobacteraceae bacterium]
MQMLIALCITLAGVAVLMLGAHWLIRGAASLAKSWRVSDLFIGLTIVAFGTSSPELFTSLAAGMKGAYDIAFANVVGSNVFNILFVLGLSALFMPLKVTHNTFKKEIPLALITAAVIFFLGADSYLGTGPNILTRGDGFVLLALFGIYVAYLLEMAVKEQGLIAVETVASNMGVDRALMFAAAGVVLLSLASQMLVSGAIKLASILGVSQRVLGLTIVAIGTSLPELATSVIAAERGFDEIAVGNVVGSNIFNALFILGLKASLAPLPISPYAIGDMVIMILVSAVLLIHAQDLVITKVEGGALLAGYAFFIYYLLQTYLPII